MKPLLLVIAGPTASGKTALAVELCRRIGGEVVSADSMQIYRDLHIGTARPSAEEQGGIPHHLMGYVPWDASFSVAKYAADADAAIAAVHARGRVPVLCGGTGLYIQAVTEHLQYTDQPEDRTVREELNRRAAAEGGEVLLSELRAIDAETAERLHPHDVGRIVRALELYRTTGRTVSEQNRASRERESPYEVRALYLDFHERAVLYDRIDRRVDAMVAAGLEQEARTLWSAAGTDTVRQAIGYKEWGAYFDGACTAAEAAEAVRIGTRHYAKRQLSWFRNKTDFLPLYVDEYASVAALCDAAAGLLRV